MRVCDTLLLLLLQLSFATNSATRNIILSRDRLRCASTCCENAFVQFLAAGNKVARGYMFYRLFFFSFLANRSTCDQTADRRRVKSIPVLRTYVAWIIRIDISTSPTLFFTEGKKVRNYSPFFDPTRIPSALILK